MQIQLKPVEIFCGTGGVGKTTLATARALYLAKNNKKVLLITLDPSKRLKEVLKIDDVLAGDIQPITPFKDKSISIDALLMSPDKTIERMAKQESNQALADNKILKILTSPYGGMNEILSVVEVEANFQKEIYDTIILDTPPGDHFVDFLQSSDKIRTFFDTKFIEVFKLFKKKNDSSQKNIFKLAVKAGLNKLLDYLQKVTGPTFLEDFIEAVSIIYSSKKTFMSSLALQERLKKEEFSNWFLVTSIEQSKLKEAMALSEQAKGYFHNETYLLINKCMQKKWESIGPQKNEVIEELKNSQIMSEKNLKQGLKNFFPHVLEFQEVLERSPLEHVEKLSLQWEQN